MIASQLSRVSRATTQSAICSIPRTISCTRPAVPPTLCYGQRLQQRRPSSSKASCPPGDSSNGPRAAAAQATRSPTAKAPAAQSSRSRKAKATESQRKEEGNDKMFNNLPKVPSTDEMHMEPKDVAFHSFFSLHMPVTLRKTNSPMPDHDAFSRLFEPPQPPQPTDIVYTLENTIESLENLGRDQGSNDLEWNVVQESPSNAEGSVRHLDGAPRTKSLHEIVGGLKPFNVPPPPQPWTAGTASTQSKSKSEKKNASQSSQQMYRPNDQIHTATIIIQESTNAEGVKFFTASTYPAPKPRAPKQRFTSQNKTKLRLPAQPFLNRMLDRQWQNALELEERIYEEPTTENVSIEDGGKPQAEKMEAISVKRQRKLKMKKHKYKKLMKRTRNLRRRLDRA
ncbi:hypothetical protein MBLNU457_6860t1 [Dothideomycetes sp. NU457]